MHREVLFDLTVGSLFHEAMKLRENLYQQEVYVPQVEQLLEEHGTEDHTFFREFEKIQAAGADRTLDAMRETEVLLGQTRKQLRALLKAHAENRLLIRNLIEDAEAVESVFEVPLAELLADLHGSAAAGYRDAAHSYLASAFFESAYRCLDIAIEQAGGEDPHARSLDRLRDYAEGMARFTAGDYPRSIDRLERWIHPRPGGEEARYLVFAELALSRIAKLVDAENDREWIERAETLVEVIRGTDVID